ncbi:lytic transglycosylase domain-containing protein [Rubellimicrobium roseum]|uniref:Lytic transglycosylase domain-containing protein n=1 Tax=Rubellimicrobium roseum TaxID=687525 RepID=A0A5C4N8U7_9RHOB|nr:lytic transglycosylase domain-containing protein [Rubellimicrobium roseum]TNC66279.1 lytic transglycosylase domain-containing protein [Rubellimicrobium roseum]
MVLVMREDGVLEASRDGGTGFARYYGDGVRSEMQGVLLFGGDEAEFPEELEPATMARASHARAPASEVLAEIDAAALRYAGHDALRQAGLSVTEWLHLYRANIEIESGYNPQARSPVGAIGLGQLMPGTASLLEVDPHDWRQNLDGSARYLLMQLGRFRSPELALAAYNAGPEAVLQYGGIPPYQETQGHVRKVMSVVARLGVEF